MLIGGWDNKDDLSATDALTRSDTKRLISYVSHSGITGIICYQTPNQPINFENDVLRPIYPNGRKEDAIIARTWSIFQKNSTFSDVLLRLPMTKATVRAMDAAEDFMVQLGHDKPVRWGVTGASKRGWTAWTHAAVDYERVIFVSPVWLDNLKLIESSHHHYQSLGGWTMQYVDYYIEGFTLHLDDPAFEIMADIVDPYTYLERYSRSQTILLQNAGNDEFFLPSDTWFFWDEIFGEKYIRIYPNKGHGGVGFKESDETCGSDTCGDYRDLENIVWQSINGIFNEVLNPVIFAKNLEYRPWTWNLLSSDDESAIEFFSNIKPTSVRAWLANSAASDRCEINTFIQTYTTSTPSITIHIVFVNFNVKILDVTGVYLDL